MALLANTEMVPIGARLTGLGGSEIQLQHVREEMAKRWQAPGASAAEPHTYT